MRIIQSFRFYELWRSNCAKRICNKDRVINALSREAFKDFIENNTKLKK